MFLTSDILFLIFVYIEPQFDDDDPVNRNMLSEPQLDEEYCVQRAMLASLCRVSKQFNAVATPLLYGRVRVLHEDIWGFTRTVLENRMLRPLVKTLSLEFQLWDLDEEVDEERQERVPTMQEEQWDYERCLSKVLAVSGLPESDHDACIVGADLQVDRADLSEELPEDVAAVLLFILPGLRCLRVMLEPMTSIDDIGAAGYWICDLFLQSLRLPHYIRSQEPKSTPSDLEKVIPASLLHLEELVMCNPFEPPGYIKSTYPPVVFSDVCDMKPFWGLPALKSLTLERTHGGQDFPEPSLTSPVEHLTLLDTAIDPPDLPRVLDHFSSLRSVRYFLSDSFSLIDPAAPLMTPAMLDFPAIEKVIRGCCPGLDKVTVGLFGVTGKEMIEEELMQLREDMADYTGSEEDEEEEEEEGEEGEEGE